MKAFTLLAAIAAGLVAADAAAQPAGGAIVSGTAGVVAIGSGTDVSVSGAAGYRFNRAFGLGIEVTAAPTLSRHVPVPLRSAIGSVRDASGRLTVFTTNVRLEIPTTTPRVVPYAVVGGGVANIDERADVIIAVNSILPTPQTLIPLIYPPPDYSYRYASSTTGLALTVGGGASIVAVGRLSVDVDLRYLRLMGNGDRNIGRFGIGASYRF
jgi:opacity protein-like surface antigen